MDINNYKTDIITKYIIKYHTMIIIKFHRKWIDKNKDKEFIITIEIDNLQYDTIIETIRIMQIEIIGISRWCW